MRNRDIVSLEGRLDALFKMTRALEGEIEIQSHWARYLCVVVSGYLEVAVRSIYSDYARGKAHKHVANYVEGRIKGFQNPKMDKILEVTRLFSPQWERDLAAATVGELKDSVDSICTNRNKIAHGESVGLSISRVKQYYSDALKVIALLEKQCDISPEIAQQN